MQDLGFVRLERDRENATVAIVTLNREEVGNAFNTEMLNQFHTALEVVENDTSFRVMVLRSSGRHGSYGADLNELVAQEEGEIANLSYIAAFQVVLSGRKIAIQLFKLRVPTIGLMKGYCLGGGAAFYALCDVLYAASGPFAAGGLLFGFPETPIGVMNGWMAPEIMTRRIGPGHTSDLFLSGRFIDAQEALQMGIIQKACPPDQLEGEGLKWARMVAANAPLATESTKRTIRQVTFAGFEDIALNTIHETTGNLLTADFLAGMQKTLAKEKKFPEYRRK